jgi:hypothetical protein
MRRSMAAVSTLIACGWLMTTGTSTTTTEAGGVPSSAGSSSTTLHPRKVLVMAPRCFVAGQHRAAHVGLADVGPRAAVEFIWAPKNGITLGPGYGPGIFRADANGDIAFSAVPPSKYGSGTVGQWVLAAEWRRASHAFIRLRFKIVTDKREC